MAVPTITKHLDIYEGKTIECAAVNIVDPIETELIFPNLAPVDSDYVFQMVAKTDEGSNLLSVAVGDSVAESVTIGSSKFTRIILKFEDVKTLYHQDLSIVFANAGTVYLYNLQLERSTVASEWRPAPEDVVEEAAEESESRAQAVVDAQTQLDIFNKLTDNGRVKGIYLQDGELYMNASYIRTGTISADRIAAGAVTISKLANDVSSVASSEEQLIYISKPSGTTSVAANTTWVTNATGNQNVWTTRRPQYNSSYPVLFIAKQKKTVGGTVGCTTPVIDQTTTVIDGGHITTGTIDASKVTVTNLSASNITTGTMSANRISGGSIDATNVDVKNLNASKITSGILKDSGGNFSFELSTGKVTAKKLSITSTNFTLTEAGVMTAKGATIDGGIIKTSTYSGSTETYHMEIGDGCIDGWNKQYESTMTGKAQIVMSSHPESSSRAVPILGFYAQEGAVMLTSKSVIVNRMPDDHTTYSASGKYSISVGGNVLTFVNGIMVTALS